MAEQYDTESNVKLGRFRSQLQVSYVSSPTKEMWYNETVCEWMTIYIYIYIYMCVCVKCRPVIKFVFKNLCKRIWSSIRAIIKVQEEQLSINTFFFMTAAIHSTTLAIQTTGYRNNSEFYVLHLIYFFSVFRNTIHWNRKGV